LGLFTNTRGGSFLAGYEGSETLINCVGNDFFVFELQSQPLAFGLIPFFGQTGGLSRNRRPKTQSSPKQGSFLRPKPENAVMRGDLQNAVPKHFPCVIGEGKVKVAFTVQSRMLPDNLHANGAQKFAVGGFHNLKFNQTFSQLIGGQAHERPQCFEVLKILCGRTADMKLR
jgi:hypothetical protein